MKPCLGIAQQSNGNETMNDISTTLTLTDRQLDLIAAAIRREIESNQACYWSNLGRDDRLAVEFCNHIAEKKELLKAIGRPF